MAGLYLTEDAVRSFLLACGGKSTNHDLVTHFKPFLSDPENKAKNRERFKEIVNTLSTVKMGDDDVKYLILKKKYRGSSIVTNSNLSLNSLLGSSSSLSELIAASPSPAPTDNAANDPITFNYPSSTADSSAISQSNHRAKSEPPSVQQSPDGLHEVNIKVPTQPTTDDNISKTENNLPNSKIAPFQDSNSTISSSSLASTASEEEIVDAPPEITSVKDRAKHLNKLQSDSDLLKLASRKNDKSKHEKGKDGSEHDDDSAFVSLTPEQKEWMITASNGDYQDISKLLSKNPQLAKERSFINTALHWAAKHGNPDIVKLLCGKPGINVDQKTGFTPLHLASMHGHDDVIELLILTYKANPNLRDHSGKKPKQYLSSSASAKCQQILQTRTITERPIDEFERSEAIRKSKNRVAAIGNRINSSNIMKAQPIVRSSWGGSCENLFFDRGSGYSSHSQSPSSSRETSPVMAKKELGATSLMPPPTAPVRKKKTRSKTLYSSKENVQFDFPVIPIRKNDSDNQINLQVPSSSFV